MGTFPQDLEAYLSTIVNTPDEKASADAMMAERDQLQNKVIEVQTALEEADATNLAQGTKISELKGQLREARASLQLALQAERPTKEDKAKIPDPARFDGSNKDKYRIFISQLRLKTMPWASEQEKLRYAVSLLAGTAYEQIGYLVKPDRIDLPDLESLISMLDVSFDNKHRKMEAEQKIKIIK